MEIVIGTAVLIAALAYVCAPFFSSPVKRSPAQRTRENVEGACEAEDLELDFRLGKLSREDYERERQQLERD